MECGVWRGGSSMLGALVLQDEGQDDRPLYLYDTFSGMAEPSARDRTNLGMDARAVWADLGRKESRADWCKASLNEVRSNMASTGYPEHLLNYVVGKVEESLPATMPGEVSILRLDTDWYESTKHELECLYPVLSSGGVLILDDYGCWEGAREATDEYFAGLPSPPFLARIDSSARIAIKP